MVRFVSKYPVLFECSIDFSKQGRINEPVLVPASLGPWVGVVNKVGIYLLRAEQLIDLAGIRTQN